MSELMSIEHRRQSSALARMLAKNCRAVYRAIQQGIAGEPWSALDCVTEQMHEFVELVLGSAAVMRWFNPPLGHSLTTYAHELIDEIDRLEYLRFREQAEQMAEALSTRVSPRLGAYRFLAATLEEAICDAELMPPALQKAA